VFETRMAGWESLGSVCSGGRYDSLASDGRTTYPGVGISLGVTRLFYQLQEAGLLDAAESSVQALVGLLDEARLHDGLQIARGLDYYTGTVYETTLNEHPQIGSICSGGRYDNLATNYTKSRLPGVGISIGATRLFYQLREAKLLGDADSTVKVLVTQMDETQLPAYLELAALLRNAGIATEVVMEAGKLGKQVKHADRAGIRFVVVLGPDEIAKGVVTVKDMRKEDQYEVPRADLVKTLRVELEQAEAMKA